MKSCPTTGVGCSRTKDKNFQPVPLIEERDVPLRTNVPGTGKATQAKFSKKQKRGNRQNRVRMWSGCVVR
jgi:hypothetical protein